MSAAGHDEPTADPATAAPVAGVETGTAAELAADLRLLLDDLRRAAMAGTGAALSLIGIFDRGELEVVSGDAELADPATPAPSLWAAVAAAGFLSVPDAHADPRFDRHPAVVGPPHLRRFLGAAAVLDTSGRHLVLGVADRRPEAAPEAPERLGRLASLAALLLGNAVVTAPAAPSGAGSAPAGAGRAGLERRALAMARIGAFVYDRDGGEWSEEMFRILGRPPHRSRTAADLAKAFSGEAARSVAAAIAAAGSGQAFDLVVPLEAGDRGVRMVRITGQPELVDGVATTLRGTVQEIAAVPAEGAAAAAAPAEFDVLTGLPARQLLQRALERRLDVARVLGERVGLLVADLDYFREVNRIHGQEQGDRILQTIAKRLLAVGGAVGRIGGDEFAVVLQDVPDVETLMSLAHVVIHLVEQPILVAGVQICCRASVGAALYPDHAEMPSRLVESALAATARAKASGRGIAFVYDPERERGAAVLDLHAAVRGALGRDEIIPYYQPKISLGSGAVIGYEALARWRRVALDPALPETFGAAFSDGTLGGELTQRILEKVTDDIRDWLAAELPFGHVAVNATSIDLIRGSFVDRLAEILGRKRIPPDRLQVEVTETIFLAHEEAAIARAVGALHKMGVVVGLDDFGTGYGSLAHLRRLPVGYLKIDRSFLSMIDRDADNRAIVQALIGLCARLGKGVVAEGVEREEERDVLVALGCECAQGFLFSPPLPAETARRHLERMARR